MERCFLDSGTEGSLDGHPTGSSNSSSGSSIVQLIAKPDDILTYCSVHMPRQRILLGIEANLTTKTRRPPVPLIRTFGRNNEEQRSDSSSRIAQLPLISVLLMQLMELKEKPI